MAGGDTVWGTMRGQPVADSQPAGSPGTGPLALGLVMGLVLGRLWPGPGGRPNLRPAGARTALRAAGAALPAAPSVRIFQVQQGPGGPIYVDTSGVVFPAADDANGGTASS